MQKLLIPLIVLSCALALAQPATAPSADPAGHWEGSIELPGGQSLGVIVDLSLAGNDWRGTIDIPAQGAQGLPLENIQVDGVNVRFTIKGIPGTPTFKGTLEGGKLAGDFTQGAAELTFELSREKTVSAAFNRPQEPKPPFPYREEEFTAESGGVKLAGTLCIPEGTGPFPAVILLSDFGAQTRDADAFGHKPFKLLADRLARVGIATLRCDDRGMGQSTGDYMKSSHADLAADARAMLDQLKSHATIDPARIGLLGQGDGASVATAVASGSDDVKFVVLISPAGVTGAQIMQRQSEEGLKAAGMNEQQIAEITQVQSEIFDTVRDSANLAEAEPKLRELIGKVHELLGPALQAALGQRDEFIRQQLQQINTPLIQSLLRNDPAASLRKVRQPVLAIWGGLNPQLDVQHNAEEVQLALREADNNAVSIRVLDGLNHFLQPANTGQLAESADIETTMDEAALEDIVDWVKARTGT